VQNESKKKLILLFFINSDKLNKKVF